jgi:hypothetical protein
VGHVFSLLVSLRDADYTELHGVLEASPLLARPRTAGDVIASNAACRPGQSRAEVSATSDPARDPVLQRAWPHFFMGVSASWLALVQEFAADIPPEVPDLVAAYAAVYHGTGGTRGPARLPAPPEQRVWLSAAARRALAALLPGMRLAG